MRFIIFLVLGYLKESAHDLGMSHLELFGGHLNFHSVVKADTLRKTRLYKTSCWLSNLMAVSSVFKPIFNQYADHEHLIYRVKYLLKLTK